MSKEKQIKFLTIAREFLNNLDEDSFCQWEQTKNFKSENIGINHCALGHLYVNPSSPFFNSELVNNTYDSDSFVDKGAIYTGKINPIIIELAVINNFAPKGQIKDEVIKFFDKKLEKLFG